MTVEKREIDRMQITTKEMVEKTTQILKEKSIHNPWFSYNPKDFPNDYILEEDTRFIKTLIHPIIHKKMIWESTTNYDFHHQFPVPINGNFLKAKYLLLYSNPGTEKEELLSSTKDELIQCFKLDPNSKLVIPNDNKYWEDWYIGELDKFFVRRKNETSDFELQTFLDDFCFINLFAYPTSHNAFDFNQKELDQLHQLPSTLFSKALVEIGIESGKEIIIIRRSDGVWKHSIKNDNYLFEKLSSYYHKHRK